MYRTPEIVDLYSNFPIGEKQDIWVRQLACVPGQPDWPPGALGEAAAARPSASLPLPWLFLSSGGSFSSSAALVTLLVDRC